MVRVFCLLFVQWRGGGGGGEQNVLCPSCGSGQSKDAYRLIFSFFATDELYASRRQ